MSQGKSCKEIAAMTGFRVETIRRYAKAASPPARGRGLKRRG